MLKEVSFFKNIYNSFLLKLCYFTFEEKYRKKIDKKVYECITNLDFKFESLSPRVLKNIKASIIKECFFLPYSKANLTSAYINVERRLAIQLISSEKFISKSDPLFLELKIKYLKNLELSAISNRKLNRYLKNSTIKKLAQRIDQEMEGSLTLEFQSFAQLVALDYKKELQKAISSEGKEPGADELVEACFALILLQKNCRFQEAIQDLMQHLIKNPGSNAFIEAACLNYQGGINLIRLGNR